MFTIYPVINDFVKHQGKGKPTEAKIGDDFFQALDDLWIKTYAEKYKEEYFQSQHKKFQRVLKDWKEQYDNVFKHLIHCAFNKPNKIYFSGRQYPYEPSWEKIAIEHFLIYLVKNQIVYFIELKDDEWLEDDQNSWRWKIRLLNLNNKKPLKSKLKNIFYCL